MTDLKTVSAIDNQELARFKFINREMNKRKITEFLRNLINDVAGKTLLIVNNHHVYNALDARGWFTEHANRIESLYLPPYEQILNPDEYLSRDLNAHLRHTYLHDKRYPKNSKAA